MGPGNGTVMASVIELVVAAVQTFRASRSGGWTVGVVRRGGPIVGERIVAKEHVASEAELDARIEQLAENVRAGTLT